MAISKQTAMAGRFPATADVYATLTGGASLPVVEVDRDAARAPRVRIVKRANQWARDPNALITTTLGHALGELPVREWEMYHAAAKTALSRNGFAGEEYDYGIGTYLQNRHLVIWDRGNLRLRRGGIFSRTDAARSAMSGRLGEAMLFLFMKARQYRFWDHIPALAERALNKLAVPHKEQVRFSKMVRTSFPDGAETGKRPDFVFEKKDGESALAEAKGAFIEQGGSPSMVKGDFGHGLSQLAAWERRIRPRAKKCFVVGTYLREIGDPHGDPSLVAFVDPEDDAPEDGIEVEFPSDWVRRGNYGAWLIGMGFDGAGEALRNGEEIRTIPCTLPTITLGRQRFAFIYDSCLPPWWWSHELFFFLTLRHRILGKGDVSHVPIVGVEVDTLRSVETSVNNSAHFLTIDAEPGVPDTVFPEWFSGSIFPDGSLVGALHVHPSKIPIDGEQTFQL
jgi:hypothetical protein